MPKALIFGITGQDGSYLAEVLLEKGYEVHGFIRRTATGNTRNIEHILDKITLHRGDVLDTTSLYRVINEVRPDEIYNEADQDHAGWSFDLVDYQYRITGVTPGAMLEIVRQLDPKIKFFQPITSNVFGKAEENPQTENTPFRPQSPYACAKVLAYVISRFYREAYGMFVATGIFYNHESPRRPEEYVTRKITRAAAKIKLGLQDTPQRSTGAIPGNIWKRPGTSCSSPSRTTTSSAPARPIPSRNSWMPRSPRSASIPSDTLR